MDFLSVVSAILASLGASASEPKPALSLEISETEGRVEVRLIGQSRETLDISYTLDVSGQSRSTHRGSTTLQAGTRSVLSTIRVGASDQWCARLSVVEDGGERYELVEGRCENV